jgi:hypothetical protein
MTPAPGHGRLRASHADREQVVDVLKAGKLPPGPASGQTGPASPPTPNPARPRRRHPPESLAVGPAS